jgi:putative ABC transport system substrate-binding protein
MKRREFITLLGSAVASWPLPARAQQNGMPVIGLLSLGFASPNSMAAFRQGLAEAGYIESNNVAIEFRSANLDNSLLPRLVADLVARKVDVIVTTGSPSVAVAAKAAASKIPIVFNVLDDPRKYGLVASLNRPEGNLTGMNFLGTELAGKRLNLLIEVVSKTATIAYLSRPTNPSFAAQRSDMLAAAHALGRDIFIAPVEESDFDAAFATIAQRRAGALIVGNYAFFVVPSHREQILELAGRYKIPAIYPDTIYTVRGGLMSYNADILAIWRQLGSHYVGQILRGAKPADLPVQQPSKFEFVINVRTAKALGLTIPRTLLAAATKLIE